MPPCSTGCGKKAVLKRPKTGQTVCRECFFWAFEEEIHHTIVVASLFNPGEYVAIAASGGKDSTVLAYIMKCLNERYNYGLKLVLLSIDEGITGYRDDSLETVKRNEIQYEIPLKILSYDELYGWTMDRIVDQVGRKNNCTFCGVFRRQALDRGAALLKVDKIVTGHNADDIAETVIMNILRGDIARLSRCTAVQTGSPEGGIPRSKPFKYTYEKEIVMYAYFKKLDYFSTECIYSPNAYRGHARAYLKDLERIRPSSIIDVIHSGECLGVKENVTLPLQSTCTQCHHVSSGPICKACQLLQGLNRGKPRLGIGKTCKIMDALSDLAPQNGNTKIYNNETCENVEGNAQKACCGGMKLKDSELNKSSVGCSRPNQNSCQSMDFKDIESISEKNINMEYQKSRSVCNKLINGETKCCRVKLKDQNLSDERMKLQDPEFSCGSSLNGSNCGNNVGCIKNCDGVGDFSSFEGTKHKESSTNLSSSGFSSLGVLSKEISKIGEALSLINSEVSNASVRIVDSSGGDTVKSRTKN